MLSEDQFNNCLIQDSGKLLIGVSKRDRLELKLIKKRHRFEPGRFPISAGAKPHGVLVHCCGLVHTISPLGIHELNENMDASSHCVYGLTEILADRTFNFSVETITSAEFDVIEREDLLQFISKRPDVIRQLNAILSGLYRNTVQAFSRAAKPDCED